MLTATNCIGLVGWVVGGLVGGLVGGEIDDENNFRQHSNTGK